MRTGAEVCIDLLLETGGGGSANHVLHMFHGLRRLGWNVHLILSSRRAEATFATQVQAIDAEHVSFLQMRRAPHPSDLPALARLQTLMKRSAGRHLLHAHSTKAAILGWALPDVSACRVLTPHAYRGMDPTLTEWKRTVVQRAESIFSRRYDAVIAVSPDESRYAESLGVKPERIHCIPNGVDMEAIAAASATVRAARGAAPRPTLGFVGRLVNQKNPELFLDVLRVLVQRGSDVQAVIVGDGAMRSELLQMAERYHIADRVEWRGNVPAIEELGKMDVMVHTSHYESLPYSLLEAVAASVPMVAVENAGSRAILGRHLPEAIIPVKDAEVLADAVQALLTDSPVRKHQLHAYAKIAQEFTVDVMVKRTAKVYEEVLQKSLHGSQRTR